MLCVCVAHVVVKAARDARVAEGQAERAAEARVRAALHTDLLLLLARVAEHGAIATGGDAMNLRVPIKTVEQTSGLTHLV